MSDDTAPTPLSDAEIAGLPSNRRYTEVPLGPQRPEDAGPFTFRCPDCGFAMFRNVTEAFVVSHDRFPCRDCGHHWRGSELVRE
jgi:hypothetical protein